ncbi:hypothetical protein OU789_08850 [Halocynthiibacter sp. C4]|uniref:hypothetical protein n=1 Tax=Halocynthiibacter sp. C4 TaxID=2992758 RepID=UPI00237A2DB3|nr:hypothetical protein [Halocynthiibacter sp. C4]MDE0590029.1 hypothetical protein [Halocynthiibacter sp. C4]
MQVVFHLGVHSTDSDKLLKSLLKDKGKLALHGVAVPGPGKYRALIRTTIADLEGARSNQETRQKLFDSMLQDNTIERVVLTNENFICVTPRVFDGIGFYPQTIEKVVSYCNLFYGHDVEFQIAISNPAVLIPTLFNRMNDISYKDYLSGTDPMSLRWSSVINQIREASPQSKITCWCNEDAPVIWSEVLHSLVGLDTSFAFRGEYDLLEEIMTKEGLERFYAYLKTHPPQSALQQRRIIAAFLDKFVREEVLDIEIDLPGWDDDYVAALTAIYEDDILEIKRIPGVRFIEP